MLKTILSAVLIFILSPMCKAVYNDTIPGYDLTAPDVTLILPDTLHEISGMTSLNSSSIACIQDENGILFIFNFEKNKIERQFTFSADGDYEDITRVDNAIYILRSDGVIFEINNYSTSDFKVNTYNTAIPAEDNEGLCYDRDKKRLLVASKGKIGEGTENKGKRAIYGFDLKKKILLTDPVFDINLDEIQDFADRMNIVLPPKTNKKGQLVKTRIKFRTSAICIHPMTKKLYLISDSDHLMFVFNMNGTIEHIRQLDTTLFNKAEGITFLDNGDMLISNEGQGGRPTLLRFNYRPVK